MKVAGTNSLCRVGSATAPRVDARRHPNSCPGQSASRCFDGVPEFEPVTLVPENRWIVRYPSGASHQKSMRELPGSQHPNYHQ
jgi:hypothetical protein